MLRVAVSLFLLQAGFHGYTAALPLALSRAGRTDPEIGLIVGVAALIQIPAALVAGMLIDRFGGVRLMVVGGVAYLLASLLLLLPGIEPEGPIAPFLAARILQGIGLATALPAGLSVIPRLVERARHGLALAIGGSSHNLALVVMPPLSVAVLGAVGFDGVHLVIGGVVVAGLATILARPVRPLPTPVEGLATARRRLGFAYRADWTAPLAIMVLSVANWGVISAYLPQRADAVNADIGLFFAAAGAGILLGRIPSGWLADRLPPLWPILAGVTVTVVGMLLLLVPPTTALLVVAGALSGGGTALIVTPLLLVLSRRSNEADRGSAFGLFAGSFALAIAIGSVGVAPVIERAGFELAMVAMLVALGLSGVVALFDRGLRGQERDRTAGAASAAELPPIEP